jgi:hypothetical protein
MISASENHSNRQFTAPAGQDETEGPRGEGYDLRVYE